MNTVTDQGAVVVPRKVHMTLQVNGEDIEVSFAPYKTLLEVLREDMGLTGTKHGCERIKEALSGNLCRCTGYQQIFESVEEAARVINSRKAGS